VSKKKFVVQVHSSGLSLSLDSANIGGLRQRKGEDSYGYTYTHSYSDSDAWSNAHSNCHTYSNTYPDASRAGSIATARGWRLKHPRTSCRW
jgi:hypothetical protein